MKRPTIYLDNAATSHPKPEEVYLRADKIMRQGGSAGRAAHELAVQASREVFETRMVLASFLGIETPERLVFTPGCTQSINMVLGGLKLAAGDKVIVSALEHNAVMRPLHKLKSEKGIEIIQMPYAPGEIVNAQQLEQQINSTRPRLCIFTEASNVTGEMLDLEGISRQCATHEIPFLIDAAQSAGAAQTGLKDLSPQSFWCASGHKGLYGMQGVGLLYVAPGVDIEPLILGGTGSHSEELMMPQAFPDKLEAGTAALPSIATLLSGVEYLEKRGTQQIRDAEMRLCRRFLDWLAERKEFSVIAATAERRVPLVSFEIKGIDPGLVAELLDRDFGICVRAGLHCAASAHATLGTLNRGLMRVSFGAFNTEEELDSLCKALAHIEQTAHGG